MGRRHEHTIFCKLRITRLVSSGQIPNFVEGVLDLVHSLKRPLQHIRKLATCLSEENMLTIGRDRYTYDQKSGFNPYIDAYMVRSCGCRLPTPILLVHLGHLGNLPCQTLHWAQALHQHQCLDLTYACGTDAPHPPS